MSDFRFINGSRVSVRFDGAAVGGVEEVFCRSESTDELILEYLTDVPVEAVPSVSHTLKITIRLPEGGSPVNCNPELVELEAGGRTVRYSGCRVKKLEADILPSKDMEYVITLVAAQRSEL